MVSCMHLCQELKAIMVCNLHWHPHQSVVRCAYCVYNIINKEGEKDRARERRKERKKGTERGKEREGRASERERERGR